MAAMIFFVSIFGICAIVVLYLFLSTLTTETGSITAEEAQQRTKQEEYNSKVTYSACCHLIDREIKLSADLMYTECGYWVPDYLVEKVKEKYTALGYTVREDGYLYKKDLPTPVYDRMYKLIFDWGEKK